MCVAEGFLVAGAAITGKSLKIQRCSFVAVCVAMCVAVCCNELQSVAVCISLCTVFQKAVWCSPPKNKEIALLLATNLGCVVKYV